MIMAEKTMRHLIGLGSWILICSLLSLSSFPVHAETETPRIMLRDTEITKLIEVVSKFTDKNFVIDPAVRGKVTFVSGKGLTEDELYDAFLSILQVHGFEAVEAGNVTKILPIGEARSQQVAPIVEAEPNKAAPKVSVDETVTQVFQLQYIPAQTALQTLTPIAGQGETRIQMNLASNAIIVTGRGQNVQRLGQVIRNIDKPNNQDVELVELQHSGAAQMAQTLRELMSGAGNSPDGGAIPQTVRISVDERTNSILLAGDRADRERMRTIIRRLDIPRTQPSETQVVPLKYTDATPLLKTLKELQVTNAEGTPASRQARIAADERTNSILVSGPRTEREHILSAIKRLDIPKAQFGGEAETQVVPLKYAVAQQLLQTLKELQITGSGADGAVPARQARIAADQRTNSILVSGSRKERQPIVKAIARLDIAKDKSGGTRVVPLRYAKAEEMVKVLSDTAKGIQEQTAGTVEGAPATSGAGGGMNVSIQADPRTNAVIINAPQHIQNNLLKVVYQLDRRQAQVLIEAIIAEVSTDLSNRLGFGMGAFNNDADGGGVAGSSNFGNLDTILNLASGGVQSVPSGLLFGVASNNFGVVLDALRGDGATNILSTPTIVTIDNEEASIVVGQNVPFVTGSYSGTGDSSNPENPFQTIQRQDVGLTLKVTPQINRGKTIQMKIEQEVSSLASSSSGASDVITNKRSINTNVMVEDGQILVLGGLIQDSFTDSEQRVPVLSDIPVIGNAFKNNETKKTKQNLMAFIHPVILPDREAADAYTRDKYHNLQKQQRESRVLQRGNSDNNAAVFPDIECIDNTCGRGSADDLHFNKQQQQRQQQLQRQRQQQLQQQQRQQQLQRQRQQQQRQQQLQRQRQQQLQQQQRQRRAPGLAAGKREPDDKADCVPGFCQMYE